MKKTKECLLIGDSNFINKKIFNFNNTQKSLCLGELIQYRLKKENIKIFNFSYWGENIIDIYKRFIINGPIPNKNPKLIFIGLGTNDANYFYSINNYIISPKLHYIILNDMVEIFYNYYQNSKICILPIPKISPKGNNELSQKINKQINLFNKERLKLCNEKSSKLIFLNHLNINPNYHLDNDGIHYNKAGITFMADNISEFIVNYI